MKKIKKRDLISFACVFCSSLIMAATTKTFVRPAHLLSGGFMGIALLVDMIADLFGKSIPTAFTLVVLNVPVALIIYFLSSINNCYKIIPACGFIISLI